MVAAQIPGGDQDDASRGPVHYRRRIAADVFAVVPHRDEGTPAFASVRGAAQDQVDVACVGTAVAPSFGEGEQSAVGRDGQRRDAECVVTLRLALENRFR